ncbi:MAG: NAD-dependent epimerase/dehydratase family protein [Chloroflexi bacterium AL-W]|nr:NAD-dependent epimerase/dehydratase family protein [Chloroflexi bacterium AL-W]
MIRKKVNLITGANGEVGHGLIRRLSNMPDALPIVVLDIRNMDENIMDYVDTSVVGDILDKDILDNLSTEYEIETIFHLAALLSTHSEFRPETAHRVNVQGTLNLLHLAVEQSDWRDAPVKFIFPSSVAVYGLPDFKTKQTAPPLLEDQYVNPITMYGCNKLYCEHLGRYYSAHYRQLANRVESHVDFRCVRFPGLISAMTMPSGGTSDYAPEIIHAAAKGEAYQAFVRPDTTMPFMAMPDAIDALLNLAAATKERLTQYTYNVTGFSISAEQITALVKNHFPQAEITYAPVEGRQRIVDSWPTDVDDSAARRDWDWMPRYGVENTFTDYLIPIIRALYA